MAKDNISKERIVATAEKILTKQGYENTSLNIIIQESGVSKGTFYHYFNSKESLLDQLMRKMSDAILAPVRKIVNDPGISAIAKFNSFIEYSARHKIKKKKFLISLSRWLWKEENIKIRYKILHKNVRLIVPELTKIINQGVREGSFKVRYPNEAAESIISLGIALGDQIAPHMFELNASKNNELIVAIGIKMKAFEENITRILGAEDGKLKVYDENILSSFFD